MSFKKVFLIAAIVFAANTVQAQDSVLILGKSSYGARCAVCHGEDGKGGGEVAGLFQVPPSDLTKLTERNGGAFPFSEVYQILASGLGERAHGNSQMPIWGEYFLADSLQDRGMSGDDIDHILQGRILSLTYFLEFIQE